jgi:hypothetical protein
LTNHALNLNFLGSALKDSEMSFTAVLRDLNKLNTFVRVAQELYQSCRRTAHNAIGRQ